MYEVTNNSITRQKCQQKTKKEVTFTNGALFFSLPSPPPKKKAEAKIGQFFRTAHYSTAWAVLILVMLPYAYL